MEITTTEATEYTTFNNTVLTTIDILHEPEYYNLKGGKKFLVKYYIWIIFAFGFPGNLLSFFVVMRMSRRRLTTSLFYVALLAVVDNIAIILKIIENQIHNSKVPMAAESCKCLFFLGLTFAAYPNWILIIMSAERFTAVGFPMKVGLIWSLKRAVVIIVLVLFFLCLVHLHIFFTVTADKDKCTNWPQYHSFYFPGWFFISSSVYAFIPAISLTIFNILIILLLRRSSKQRQTLLPDPDQSNDDARRQERQVTVMLVTLAIVFITLTLPRCIYAITVNYWVPTDDTGKMRKGFLNILTNNIADSNHAVNFYLYFVSGTKFRNYLLEMFHCELKHEVSNRNKNITALPVTESRM